MKLTTRYKGFMLVTTITKTSRYTTAYSNSFARFSGNFIDTINYVDAVTANK